MTPFLTRNDSKQRTACASSVRVCPDVCCEICTSTRYQVSVSNTVREATGFRSIPTSIHKYPRSVSCHVPRCPIPSQHNSHRMRFNELPQNTFSNNTPLGDDVCNDSISVECPPPVDACSQRATKRDNAHQRHTRSVQPSSCADGGFFSQLQSVSAHGLQPKRVVLQRYRSHPLSSRCRSILSAIRTATRCSSAFHFARFNRRICLLGHSRPNDHHRSLDFHLDSPGSISRSIVSRRSCQAQWAVIFAPHSPRLSGLHWSSRLRPRVLWCIAVSPKSSRPSVSLHRDVSSSDRSRC